MEKINLSPDPISLVESMRDIGYSLETAIADIIDNSITAKAQSINIRFDWNNNDPWLSVVDDGLGMNKTELISAMRLGSKSPLESRNSDDLGRFGLGLKTASFSQCRRLTVLSKKNKLVTFAEWNLDSLSDSENNPWSLSVFEGQEVERHGVLNYLLNEYLKSTPSGTIVLWGNIDRINNSTHKLSSETQFNEDIVKVKNHLELVFHRYLSPSPGESKIKLFLNNNYLESFDPFNSTKSTELRKEEFRYEGEVITVQPYVLPHHNKISEVDWKKYAGKKGYLHEQGFYVYRNRRLIIYANWFRLIRKEELTKLLRVMIDIPNNLDQLWKIDVKKSNAFPPSGVREELKRIIQKIEYAGKKVYKQRGQSITDKISYPSWNRIAKDNQIFYQINRAHPILKKYIEKLSQTEEEDFKDVISMIESTFPRQTFFNDTATNPEQMNADRLDKEQIKRLLVLFLGDTNRSISEERFKEISQIEPFASNINLTNNVMKELGYEF